MLRELKETKDHVLYKVHLHEMFRIGKLRARKVDWWFPRAERRGAGGKWKMTAKGYVVSFWSDENVPKLICDYGCTALNILKTLDLYILNR